MLSGARILGPPTRAHVICKVRIENLVVGYRRQWRFGTSRLSRGHRRIIVVCTEGYSSSLAAATLRQFGLERANDLEAAFRPRSSFTRRRNSPHTGIGVRHAHCS
jgi:hypothetical protein